MPKSFVTLDCVLFAWLFQPVSDFIAHRLGLGRATAACACVNGAAVWWMVSRAPGLSEAVAGWNAGRACFDAAVLLAGLAALVGLRIVFRRRMPHQANPLRQAMQPHRAVVLLMLVARLAQWQSPGLAEVADLMMLLSTVAGLYLGACAERPPVQRALRWVVAVG